MKRALLICLAVLAIANGTWIHVKARLSQVLLRVAWERTLGGEPDARPWPWADTRPVARMILERTGSDFIVLEGANGRVLAFAPGHLEGSARPGERGNCVITAHRDTHFTALRDARNGDVIRVQRTDGRWSAYRIESQRVVDKHDTWVTHATEDATLTLITCYPFDAIVPGGRERFVVVAQNANRT